MRLHTETFVLLAVNALWLVPFTVSMGKKGLAARRNREQRRQRLLATGLPATAVVVQVAETGPYYDRTPHLSFRLRVKAADGPDFEASAKGFFRRSDYPRLQPGAEVEVRFAPDDRRIVAVVGDQLTSRSRAVPSPGWLE
jgi:hypothetical protein